MFLTVLTLSSCVGRDFTPDYFGLFKEGEEIPTPSEGEKPPEEPAEIDVFKLVVGADGRQIEVPIPSGNILEIGTQTFIAQDESDIGPKYTASEKFKIVNSGDNPINISIPSQLGPFFISSLSNLEQQITPKQFIVITIIFNPSTQFVSGGGKITKELVMGGNTFELTGIALEPAGLATINVINAYGKLELSNAQILTFDEIPLSAHPLRQFFRCDKISCDGELRFTNCAPCLDIIGGSCELMTVNKEGAPTDEVDQMCKPATLDAAPAHEINLANQDIITTKVRKKILEVLNTGTEPLIIDSIDIKEADSSQSKGEFSTNPGAIFTADSFDEVKQNILAAFESQSGAEPAGFPLVLPPFDPPVLNTRLFLVVAYHPNDIVGSDGTPAAVGSSAKDEATLNIHYDGGTTKLSLAGTTTIKEIPALQVFVKTSTGTRPIANGEVLPFKGITSETADLALPLFMKLSDSANLSLRISSITLTGENFEWLDTKEKIEEKPATVRCSIPIFDDSGSQIDTITDLNPAGLNPNGFALEPGAHTIESMPLFGCINFRRDLKTSLETTIFKAEMIVTAQELKPNGSPAINPDGSTKETTFSFEVLGVIDPLDGEVVLRLTQTMAAIMNPQFPGISAVASDDEMKVMIANGIAMESDRDIFIMAMHLDPFDEETIYDKDGTIVSEPGDGITAVFQPIDTRAIPVTYDDPTLSDYINLIHDSLLPEGERGIFDGYPNVPEDFRTVALKIFTASLSYPGPVAPPEERPQEPSQCEAVDPCSPEGLRKLGEGPTNPAYKGVCAFFYTTGGDYYKSPAFHYPTEDPPGNRRGMCEDREEPYDLNPITGKYFLDGRMEFDDAALLFQGPTYFHTPYGPLGSNAAPLNELFHLTFTTETLLPISETKDVDRLPDKRIDVAKGEYKINLNDPYSNLPQLCENNTKNRYLVGDYYSTWRYMAPLLKKDKEGTIPAGCPEEDNNFTGGVAYITGKRLDHDTGHATFVAAAKFSSSDNLTFAFKDVMFFMILNGWFCDPLGPEEDMEGIHCFDKTFNYRDAATQYSIISGGK